MFTYIHVGFSALLGWTNRAMREPQHVDRAQNWLHVFCVYVTEPIAKNICQRGWGRKNK